MAGTKSSKQDQVGVSGNQKGGLHSQNKKWVKEGGVGDKVGVLNSRQIMLYLTGHAKGSGFLDVMEDLEDFVCENGMISCTVQKNRPGR